ncbi:Hsp33 family molecular chaperone HslO, partial [Klebsiella pneumoniae]|nr:Hsp33 family molecular chaperone HslO [Klebsiella pneumoniae]
LDHPEWEHVAALSVTLSDDELLDPALSLEHIVWRLFHEEEQVRVSEGPALSRGCRCTMQHFRDVIGRFPLADRQEMIGDDG